MSAGKYTTGEISGCTLDVANEVVLVGNRAAAAAGAPVAAPPDSLAVGGRAKDDDVGEVDAVGLTPSCCRGFDGDDSGDKAPPTAERITVNRLSRIFS